jgi:hypothetical protein
LVEGLRLPWSGHRLSLFSRLPGGILALGGTAAGDVHAGNPDVLLAEGEQSQVSGTLNCHSQPPLVPGTVASSLARLHGAAFRDKAPEHLDTLVVNAQITVSAEGADPPAMGEPRSATVAGASARGVGICHYRCSSYFLKR